jgi:farnesyl diphosphate synthase
LLVERLGIDGRVGDVATYALAGGKRVRPLVAEAMGVAVSSPASAVTRVALAVEYLHAASLLLDDLPAMDRARERRGAVPAHVRFSEADATLASVALVARSYSAVLGDGDAAPLRGYAAVRELSDAIVVMAGGQCVELALSSGVTAEEIETIHQRKTASLFLLIARLVSAEGGVDAATEASLCRFATAFGGAFQIGDDLEDRDVEGEQRGNLACVSGPGAARARAHDLLREAREAIAPLGEASQRLAQCVDWLSESLAASHRRG